MSLIAKNLNHYTILEKIGDGGMGEVYLALDNRLGRRLALKILPPEMAGDRERRQRFEREARAVASLNHRHIVTVYSVEEDHGVKFITMELVEGKVLTDLLPDSGLDLSSLLEIGLPLADALAAAHRQGITHRDLKPDNIMVNTDGQLKVLDFGLAHMREGARIDGQRTQLATVSVTQDGRILGTVAYMSPEQAEGKRVDARSDVFSLGILLYQMSTGKRPFTGGTQVSLLSSILRDTPPPVTRINHHLPRLMEHIIRRCLAKDPERRYQTALGLRNDLQELKEEMESGELETPILSPPLPPPQPPLRRMAGQAARVLGLAALLLVTILVT
ncbi:MAG: serine/threonine protein kinase [Acidobacteriota bacterium]